MLLPIGSIVPSITPDINANTRPDPVLRKRTSRHQPADLHDEESSDDETIALEVEYTAQQDAQVSDVISEAAEIYDSPGNMTERASYAYDALEMSGEEPDVNEVEDDPEPTDDEEPRTRPSRQRRRSQWMTSGYVVMSHQLGDQDWLARANYLRNLLGHVPAGKSDEF